LVRFQIPTTRDDHYPVCRLDIRQDSEDATGCGYPKTAFKRKPDPDPDIRNAFIDVSRNQTFGKRRTLPIIHSLSVMESRDLVSVSKRVSRPISASLGLGLGRFRSHLGLEGFRYRDFEYCKSMVH